MKIFLDSIGCRLNQAEIEQMARQFAEAGHTLVPAPGQADLIVLNTCAVTNEAARDSRQRIRALHIASPAARIVPTGCWATLAPAEAAYLPGVSRVVENLDKDALARIALGDELLSGAANSFEAPPPAEPFDVEPFSRTPIPGARHRTRLFVKVQDGCDNRCTFCVTRLARGPGRSRSQSAIVAEVQWAVASGAKEVVLTGVHLGAYGHDFGNRRGLAALVRAILRQTEIERLRLSSLEPWDLTPYFFSLWEAPRLCRHLHLPLQSGSAATLRRMARRTTPAEFAALVEAARRAVPEIAVSTDVIVGFPGEDEQEFEETLAYVRAMAFADLHVFKYSPRRGTVAARMTPEVSEAKKRERSRRLREIGAESAGQYRAAFIGQQLPVLWEGVTGAQPSGYVWTGHTDNALRVTTVSPRRLWNTITAATLAEAGEQGLKARLSDTSLVLG